ncbi:MAG: NAD-dependent epimerase/dehydratase family protein [Clostridia bacterium]|nr:NAD-dependent epimerase/dehydratase family protein [Clostridia bacterium]
MNKKIFITGVAGFLGSHIADRMIELGYEVIGVDNLSGGFMENVNPKIKFFKEDCNNLKKMNEIMQGCDIVFHAACTAPDGFSLFSPHFITENTFGITMSVLSAAASNGVKKFIYCSSMARYGKQPKIPYTEDSECMPATPYGVAKLASEQVIKQICELNGIYYTILVPHNILGPRQNYIDPYRNVAAIMINRMMQGKQPIIYGDGEQKRSFSFVQDCVYCIERAIIQDNLNGEVINIGPDEEFVTINELAKEIAKNLDFDLKPIYVKDRPNEVKLAICSSDKARKLLNYETKTSLADGIKEMIQDIKKKGTQQFSYNYPLEIDNQNTPETWRKQTI